ncbi:MAG TPA: threonine/serine dehydratase [Gemmatimonadales bacterium]|nr:threonine/serine dehydratase [Gemmatimonadales bacterium]
MPSLSALREAAGLLDGVALRTPLIDASDGLGRPGAPVFLKAEHLQPVGAFKVRGAYTAIARLPEEVRARGVVTQSSGNHGQAVAWAANRFGVRAVVVMPQSTPAIKVDGVRRFGGEVVFAGATRSAEQLARAEALVRDEGLVMIPPYNHPDVMAGQGTIGLEIVEQLPEVAAVLVPVSGGGLLAGIAAAIAELKPGVQVIGVEPAAAPKLSAALAAGHPVQVERTPSMADGLLAPAIGDLTFPVIQQIVRQAVPVSEDEIARAVRFLHKSLRLTVEPSGAAATAALLAGHVVPPGPTVALVSGGNVDPDLFQHLVAE